MKISHLHQSCPNYKLLGDYLPEKVELSELDTAYFQSALGAISENPMNIKRLLLYDQRSNLTEGGIEATCIGMFKKGVFQQKIFDDNLGHVYNPQTHGKILYNS